MAVASQFVALVIFLLVKWNTTSAQQSPACGTTYNIETVSNPLKISYTGSKSNHLPAAVNCSWILIVESEAFIQAKDFYLAEDDIFAVQDLTSNSHETVFGPFSGRQGPFVLALIQGHYQLEVITSADNLTRAFFLEAQKSCSPNGIYNLNSVSQPGAIRSPLYSSNRTGTFTCTIHISGYGVAAKADLLLALSIVSYNITSGSFSVSENKQHVGTYDFVHDTPPPVFLTKTMLQLSLTINRNIPDQFLVLEYEVVSEGCSKTVNLTSTNSTTKMSLSVSKEIVWQPLVCFWVVNAHPSFNIYMNSAQFSMQDIRDSLVFSGPANSEFKPVLFTSASHGLLQAGSLNSTRKHLIMKFTSPRPRAGTFVQVEASLNLNHAVYEDEGYLTMNNTSSVFKIRVQEDKMIKLSWSTPIPEESRLLVYDTFRLSSDPLLSLTSQYPLKSLALPFSNIQLVAHNFPPGYWRLQFESFPSDTCDDIQNGRRIHFKLKTSCRKINCTWIVPPHTEDDMFRVSFPTLNVGVAGSIAMYKMDSGSSPVATFKSGYTHSVYIPAKSGLLMTLQTDCRKKENLTVESLVLRQPACNESYVVSVGETVQIETPGYPQPYPMNLECNWHLTSTGYYLVVRFNEISLSSSSSRLHISAADQLLSVGGLSDTAGGFNPLPDDMLLVAPIHMSFLASATTQSFPLGSGFLLTATAFDCGSVLSAPEAELQVTVQNRFCMWSITAPGKSHYVTHLRIEVIFKNRSSLKIYDGSSMRHKIIPIMANGTIFSSGPSVMVVYQSGDQQQSGPLMHYISEHCEPSEVCGTGLCLHSSWRCNGINDCGDYSDEKDCHTKLSSPLCSTVEQIAVNSTKTKPPSKDTPETESPRPLSSREPSKGQSSYTHSTEESTSREPVDEYTRLRTHLPDCFTYKTVAPVVVVTAVVALLIGGFTVFVILNQKWWKKKSWQSLQSSNHGLEVDNVSL